MTLDEISGIGKIKDTIIGNKMKVAPGEYEVTSYTEEGGAHSTNYVTVEEEIEGLAVEEIWQGAYSYNIAITNRENQTIFILVPEEDLEKP